ncbi:MAG: Gx transporter family protein [Eubacterium sp.]|nr:Gx transporter family protein [Eubacterium sp.]
MSDNGLKVKDIAMNGLLIALAMILSYVETLIPVFAAVPGMKIGLTNIVVLVALYVLGPRKAFTVNMVRIILVAFTFGNMFAMLYSAAGGILSFVVMWALYKSGKFGPVGVSAAGGVAHNAGQIIVACLVLDTGYVFYYLPVLCISGIVAGILIGIIGGETVKRLPSRATEGE